MYKVNGACISALTIPQSLRTVLVHFYHVVHICAEQLIDVLLVNELILRPIFTLNDDGAAVFAADKVAA